jgi:hypothetical protein
LIERQARLVLAALVLAARVLARLVISIQSCSNQVNLALRLVVF